MIKILKLSSGDMILGDMREETDYIIVDNPQFLTVTQQGPVMMDLVSLFSNDKQLKLNRAQIIFEIKANSEVEQAYSTRVTGIETVSSKLII